jgi:AcrB/AcrD/AcrF family
MTAGATGLALVPLAVSGAIPGHEVEHPMALVILGGLVTSTLLNLILIPALYLRFGGSRQPTRVAPGLASGSVPTPDRIEQMVTLCHVRQLTPPAAPCWCPSVP